MALVQKVAYFSSQYEQDPRAIHVIRIPGPSMPRRILQSVWSNKHLLMTLCIPGGSAGKASTCNAGDLGLIPGLGRSAEEGKSYPLQYSGLENSMDCTVHGAAKSRTRLRDFHSLTHLNFDLENKYLWLFHL